MQGKLVLSSLELVWVSVMQWLPLETWLTGFKCCLLSVLGLVRQTFRTVWVLCYKTCLLSAPFLMSPPLCFFRFIHILVWILFRPIWCADLTKLRVRACIPVRCSVRAEGALKVLNLHLEMSQFLEKGSYMPTKVWGPSDESHRIHGRLVGEEGWEREKTRVQKTKDTFRRFLWFQNNPDSTRAAGFIDSPEPSTHCNHPM